MSVLNNKLYIFLDTITNLFVLNLVFIIACIPIFTIFPAIAAMFSVIREWRLREETTVLKPFIKHFILNFKQGVIIGLLWVLFILLLYFDFYFAIKVASEWRILLLTSLTFTTLIITFMSTYLFSIMVHYQLSLGNILKNTFIVSMVYFPTTLILVIIGLVLFLITFFIPFLFIFIFSFGAYINFLFCNRSFKKIEEIRVTV